MPGRDLAAAQLAAWEAIAAEWTLLSSPQVSVCGQCHKGVILRADSYGIPYRYTREQELALIVLHLRSHHADLDPDRP